MRGGRDDWRNEDIGNGQEKEGGCFEVLVLFRGSGQAAVMCGTGNNIVIYQVNQEIASDAPSPPCHPNLSWSRRGLTQAVFCVIETSLDVDLPLPIDSGMKGKSV